MLSFLKDLTEPLIPRCMWYDFIAVGQIENIERRVQGLKELVVELPKPNRDTLGFLISHFQGVAMCPRSWMPLANLARLFGPILIGQMDPNDDDEKYWLIEAMYGLLNIESRFFNEATDI